MTFLVPAFLWALLALPLVVVLHFLRNRRRPMTVSALFLWQVASEQARIRRRFAPAWLLLLQLLAVTLLALALAQPVLTGAGRPDLVIVIDASASMAARDSDGVRLDRASDIARQLLSAGDRVALIRAGSDATVLEPLTSDTGQLRAALEQLQAADRSADLARALDLAGAVAPGALQHVISDTAPPAGSGFTYHGVAGDGHNVGITTFELTGRHAFVALTSTWPGPVTVPLSLLRGGQLVAETEVLVPAAGQASASLELNGSVGLFEAKITPPAGDALQLDDNAFAGLRPLQVRFTGSSQALTRALTAVPGVTLTQGISGDAQVLTGVDPDSLPAGNYLLLAEPAAEPEFSTIRDWDQADPLLRFVDLRDVTVAHGQGPAVEPAGWRVLARNAGFVPLILARGEPGDLQVLFTFHPNQTDLIFRPAFPALIANIMDAFRGQPALALGEILPAGALQGGESVQRALEPGIYTLPGGPVGASLLSASQTRLPGPLPPDTLLPAPAEEQETADRSEREVAWWLLLLVPVLLAGEWLAWSRRAG